MERWMWRNGNLGEHLCSNHSCPVRAASYGGSQAKRVITSLCACWKLTKSPVLLGSLEEDRAASVFVGTTRDEVIVGKKRSFCLWCSQRIDYRPDLSLCCHSKSQDFNSRTLLSCLRPIFVFLIYFLPSIQNRNQNALLSSTFRSIPPLICVDIQIDTKMHLMLEEKFTKWKERWLE